MKGISKPWGYSGKSTLGRGKKKQRPWAWSVLRTERTLVCLGPREQAGRGREMNLLVGGGWQQLARQRELVYKGSGKKLGGGGTWIFPRPYNSETAELAVHNTQSQAMSTQHPGEMSRSPWTPHDARLSWGFLEERRFIIAFITVPEGFFIIPTLKVTLCLQRKKIGSFWILDQWGPSYAFRKITLAIHHDIIHTGKYWKHP